MGNSNSNSNSHKSRRGKDKPPAGGWWMVTTTTAFALPTTASSSLTSHTRRAQLPPTKPTSQPQPSDILAFTTHAQNNSSLSILAQPPRLCSAATAADAHALVPVEHLAATIPSFKMILRESESTNMGRGAYDTTGTPKPPPPKPSRR
ncbi:hypothetical protein B0J11DRAFT_575697 [Dendryphion nanum]|uniref:Uncharacterized protein n=1 Tax=Dendryphion nanum TaxID=256645 RepID=A0A9P9E9H6_9PLEO|nr:hypothetical protein B0J11DRAFT_575697 [Dendryphion nanum]